MYCSKCGRENTDGSRVCVGCGEALQPKESPKVVKEKMSKGSIRFLIRLAAIVVVFIGYLIVSLSNSKLPDIEDDGIVSQEYIHVFESNGLEVPESDFSEGTETAAYAIAYDSGMVEVLEFAHGNGEIYHIVNTIFVPVTGFDQTEKYDLDIALRESIAGYLALDFCTLDVERGPEFFTYKLYLENVHYQDAINGLVEVGMVPKDPNGGTIEVIAMLDTEEGLLEQGYVKR